MFKFIMFLNILISTLSFASDKEFPIIYTDNFEYKVIDAKGYDSKLEKNVKGSFSGQQEDTGIVDVFVIEITMTIHTDKEPEFKTESKYIPKQTIIEEQGNKIKIYEEEEKTITKIIPSVDKIGAPNLKVKVKEKLYNPYQGKLKKKDETYVNLKYPDGVDIIPIIPKSINLFDCEKLTLYYIVEKRLPFIYEFGHSFYDTMFDETFNVFKPLNPEIISNE